MQWITLIPKNNKNEINKAIHNYNQSQASEVVVVFIEDKLKI